MSSDIDFVVLWVDSNDETWQKAYFYYKGLENKNNVHGTSLTRFRDWDNLQYWFRAVEENCPWVRKIHFVTCGHYPKWLNKNHPKLNLVKHSDFIDEKFLPTFNANTIELNIHRIEGLSEKFVYFNDDFFVNKPLKEDFFFKNNKPCDFFVMDSLRQDGIDHFFGCIRHRSISLVNKHFRKKDVIKKQFFKIYNPIYREGFILNILNYPMSSFSYLTTPHLPQPFIKTTFKKIWSLENEALEQVCSNKFRQATDVNQYIFRNWHLVTGQFYPVFPYNRGVFRNVKEDNIKKICDDIISGIPNVMCINDGNDIDNFDFFKHEIQVAFEKRYPVSSLYEISYD